METFEGARGKVYTVFPSKVKPETAIEETARARKIKRDNLISIPVWVDKNDDLYETPVRGAHKMQAVIRKAS